MEGKKGIMMTIPKTGVAGLRLAFCTVCFFLAEKHAADFLMKSFHLHPQKECFYF